MDEARGRADWSQTSMVCAAIVNANPFRKGAAVSPDRFNPYAKLDGKTSDDSDAIKMPFGSLRYLLAPSSVK